MSISWLRLPVGTTSTDHEEIHGKENVFPGHTLPFVAHRYRWRILVCQYATATGVTELTAAAHFPGSTSVLWVVTLENNICRSF